MGEGNGGFLAHKCLYANCYTTNQRTELFDPNKLIDAVVVHGWDGDLDNELKYGRMNYGTCPNCSFKVILHAVKIMTFI